MSFKRLVTGIAFLAVFIMALRVSIGGDTWWHLRAGAWMVENGRILRVDPFSLTRLGEPWIYPGWLAQRLLYGVFQTLGLPGLNLLTACCVLVAFAFVWQTLETPPLISAFSLILGVTVSGVYWSARPQILSFALTGVVIWVLNRSEKQGPRFLLALPVIFALWANLHGGFAIGFLVLGIHLAGSFLDSLTLHGLRIAMKESPGASGLGHLLASAAVSVAAISLNPHGPVLLAYPFRTLSIGVLRNHIQEWQSPNFHTIEVQPFLWMLLLSTVALALSPRKASWRELLPFAAFAYMGFLAARNIAIFGLVAVPILANHFGACLEPWLGKAEGGRQFPGHLTRRLNLGLFLLLLAAAAVKATAPLSRRFNETTLREHMPIAATEFILASMPPGPLFNSYNWGGYVVWALYPHYLSFVDGRTDLFDDELLEDYLMIWSAGQGWQEKLDRWDIGVALLEREAPLASALQDAGWESIYEDEQAIVLAHEE